MLQSFIGFPLTFRMKSRFLPWNIIPFWIMLTLKTVLLHMLISLMRVPYLPPLQPGTPQSGFSWGYTLLQSLPLTILYLSPLIFNHLKPPLLPIYFWSWGHVHTTVPPEVLPPFSHFPGWVYLPSDYLPLCIATAFYLSISPTCLWVPWEWSLCLICFPVHRVNTP